MKKILLALALIPALVSCTGNIGNVTEGAAKNDDGTKETKEPVKAELATNETLYVYSEKFSDGYTLVGYSSVHVWGNTLELTKVVYTYWEDSNALDVETNIGIVKYRGFSTNFNIVTTYENRVGI